LAITTVEGLSKRVILCCIAEYFQINRPDHVLFEQRVRCLISYTMNDWFAMSRLISKFLADHQAVETSIQYADAEAAKRWV
jgi:hypothetical protein